MPLVKAIPHGSFRPMILSVESVLRGVRKEVKLSARAQYLCDRLLQEAETMIRRIGKTKIRVDTTSLAPLCSLLAVKLGESTDNSDSLSAMTKHIENDERTRRVIKVHRSHCQ